MGIINSYFLKASLFTEFERYIDRLRRDKKTKIDFVSIIILNYLYDSHIRWAKRSVYVVLKSNAKIDYKKIFKGFPDTPKKLYV